MMMLMPTNMTRDSGDEEDDDDDDVGCGDDDDEGAWTFPEAVA